MNTKKTKKLEIRKLTISDLNTITLEDVKGGITNTCYSADPNATCTVTIDSSLNPAKYTKCMKCVP